MAMVYVNGFPVYPVVTVPSDVGVILMSKESMVLFEWVSPAVNYMILSRVCVVGICPCVDSLDNKSVIHISFPYSRWMASYVECLVFKILHV